MVAELKVQEIYPTPLWLMDLDEKTRTRLNRDLLKKIHALTEPKPVLPVGGSWQTDPMLQELSEFEELLGLIRKAAKGALDFLQVDYDDFEITSCWANINPTGGKNSSHTHPNNYLSGVYYVAVPKGTGSIDFKDPRVQASAFMPPVKQRNALNGNYVSVPVMEGRLVLFPAWLNPEVPVNRGDKERVSISFNIMFTRFTETISPTLWRKGSAPVRTG
jgi:uncharacterized protein (TIGR02466 family)